MMLANRLLMRPSFNKNKFRYLMFSATTTWGATDYFQLVEVEIKKSGSATNLAVGKTISSSNQVAAGYIVTKLNDGVADSYLSANRWLPTYASAPAIFVIDFGSIIAADTITLWGYALSPQNRAPKDFSIAVCNNNASWKTVLSAATSTVHTGAFKQTFSW